MNYDLAKKLKDAGFPFVEKRTWHGLVPETDITTGTCTTDIIPPKDGVILPTLSELIEACGERFYELNRWVGPKWQAWPNTDVRGVPKNLDCWGDTPEEAVANLWLALNKKE